VEQVIIVTPPIYDITVKDGEFNYDQVMTAYAAWETSLKVEGVHVIDLHSAMRKARDARTEVFSRDRVHPGKEGHLFMATSILKGLGVGVPADDLAKIQRDPLFKKVDRLRSYRSTQWMRHIGYNRERLVKPQILGETKSEVAKMQTEIDALRKKK